MRLEIASFRAVKYACLNFHYAKSVPVARLSFSVFNDANEWCGVIVFGGGANNHIGRPFGLVQGQVIELVRVAMNGKQENVTKPISVALKLIKKLCPLVKLVVSYADSGQNHIGTIYQASNWFFIGISNPQPYFKINNKKTHPRTVGSLNIIQSLSEVRKRLDKNAELILGTLKYKYVYPVSNDMIPICEKLSKSYPKSVQSIDGDAPGHQPGDGGSSPT